MTRRRIQQSPLLLILALTLVIVAASSAGLAAVTDFRSRVNQTRVQVGERISFIIEISGDDGIPRVMPAQPDFGGLALVAPPGTQQSTSIANFKQSFSLAIVYTLSAPAPGTYTIGSAELEVDGRKMKSDPIVVQVVPADKSGVPESIKNEPILNPVTNDKSVNEQLKGRVFVRPRLTKNTPYVGEPVVLSYELYFDPRLAPRVSRLSQPAFDGLIADVDYQAERIDTHTVQLDGAQYSVALLYRAILTPTRPGEIALPGYNVQFRLPVTNSNARPRRPGLDDFFGDPFFERTIEVEAASGPMRMSVRPLPDEGRPSNFSGTVGNFILDSEVDRKVLTEDDIAELKVAIRGKGNAALAAIPQFPANGDFELFDQTQESEKTVTPDGLGGKKTVNYLLRPKRSGQLTIPAIDYSVFDPESGTYKKLQTQSCSVQVERGSAPQAAVSSVPTPLTASELDRRFRFAKEIVSLQKSQPAPLTENLLYWGIQFAALAAAGTSLLRSRRLQKADPASVRRGRAWISLDRKLKRVRDFSAKGDTEVAAMALERALREFIADQTNLSADGLTIGEIVKLLGERGVSEAQSKKMAEILETCSAVQYAPVGGTGAPLDDMIEASRSILQEGFKS